MSLSERIRSGCEAAASVCEDVAELEAKHAELLEAAEAVVARWDSPLWKDQPHTGLFIDQLRAAIANAKGEASHE